MELLFPGSGELHHGLELSANLRLPVEAIYARVVNDDRREFLARRNEELNGNVSK